MTAPVTISILIIMAECVLVAKCLSRFGSLPFPTLLGIFVVLSQVALTLVATGTIENEFLEFYTSGQYRGNLLPANLLYGGLLLWAYIIAAASGMRPAKNRIGDGVASKFVGGAINRLNF